MAMATTTCGLEVAVCDECGAPEYDGGPASQRAWSELGEALCEACAGVAIQGADADHYTAFRARFNQESR